MQNQSKPTWIKLNINILKTIHHNNQKKVNEYPDYITNITGQMHL